jgi:hypothetical protein
MYFDNLFESSTLLMCLNDSQKIERNRIYFTEKKVFFDWANFEPNFGQVRKFQYLLIHFLTALCKYTR